MDTTTLAEVSGNVATIGYGHTRGVKLGDTCTREQAEEWLDDDLADAEAAVDRYVKRKLSEGQRDALVSAVYNLGPKVLTGTDPDDPGSTLLHAVNDGHHFEAARAFSQWIFGGGKPMRGLLRRRLAEAALYAADPWPA